MSVAESPMMTTEELLALPDDGVDRELIRGQLREKPMTRRNRRHCRSTSRICNALEIWLDDSPEPHGEILVGEAGFRLRRDPDTTVGIDLAYISAAVAAANPDRVFLIEGVPILAVEILSPSDKHEEVLDKIEVYLEVGVALVWIVDPDLRTVTVHRPDAEPELFNATQEILAEPHLPGFRVPVAKLFSR
ncbi:Uma2 family endonuclease [soil metagenome]